MEKVYRQQFIRPDFQDQHSAHANQFAGVTDEPFGYTEYGSTRERLVAIIHDNLTDADKAFLLSAKNATPD